MTGPVVCYGDNYGNLICDCVRRSSVAMGKFMFRYCEKLPSSVAMEIIRVTSCLIVLVEASLIKLGLLLCICICVDVALANQFSAE